MLDAARLDLYRSDVVAWAESEFYCLQRGGKIAPIRLFDFQRRILRAIFSPPYPREIVLSTIKKSGKTALSALICTYVALVHTPPGAEVIVAANDYEQAQSRVYRAIVRAFKANPALSKGSIIEQQGITLSSGVRITPIARDYGSAAGSEHSLASFDELWAFTSEASRRLFDELTAVPTLEFSARLIASYAGFENEADLLLGLVKRGQEGAQVFEDLPCWRNSSLFLYYDSGPEARRLPWQTPEYYADQEREFRDRPSQFLRMHCNYFVTSESAFVKADAWDACVDPNLASLAPTKTVPIVAALDVGIKSDTSGFVGTYLNLPDGNEVRLAFADSWIPSGGQEVQLDDIESAIVAAHQRYQLVMCLFDPSQALGLAQRLRNRGVNMVEFAQSPTNLSLIAQSLLDLIKTRRLRLYPDERMREHALNTIVVENARGQRIAKEKAKNKIDLAVALAMSTYGITNLVTIVPAFDELEYEQFGRVAISPV